MGAEKLDIDLKKKTIQANGRTVREGEWVTLDGGDGSVYTGQIELVRPEPPQGFRHIDVLDGQSSPAGRAH